MHFYSLTIENAANPLLKWTFSKTFFEPKEFENVAFNFSDRGFLIHRFEMTDDCHGCVFKFFLLSVDAKHLMLF